MTGFGTPPSAGGSVAVPGGIGLMRAGGWYAQFASATATGIDANNALVVAPIFVSESTAIDRIAAEITAAGEAGSIVELGAFADGGGYPGASIFSPGSVAGDGSTGVKEATVAVTLPAGIVWLGARFGSAATTRPTMRRGSNAYQQILGAATSTAAIQIAALGIVATGQTSWPATFPAGLTATSYHVRIAVRKA